MPDGLPSAAARARRLAPRALALAGLWALLTGGAAGSWLIGIPAVAAATWASARLAPAPAPGLYPTATLRFAGLFLRESLRGGLDVAARTLGPRLRIHPGFATFDLSLQRERPRLFLTACVSLLPGTLSASLDGERLRIHLIDDRVDPHGDLIRLERAVAAMFGEEVHGV
jgi:multicomponent Na+:H+ antiporter subunit E